MSNPTERLSVSRIQPEFFYGPPITGGSPLMDPEVSYLFSDGQEPPHVVEVDFGDEDTVYVAGPTSLDDLVEICSYTLRRYGSETLRAKYVLPPGPVSREPVARQLAECAFRLQAVLEQPTSDQAVQ